MNRTVTAFLVGAAAIFGLNSCSARSTEAQSNPEQTENMNNNGKKLVVYFSHTGENYNVGYIEQGNTAIIADMIFDATGADKFEIIPEVAYPKVYDECIDIAKKELNAQARPQIKGDIAVEDYDVIFLGYPQWWREPPMCVYTFIEKHDWNGRWVIPFVTHEGSGMGGTDLKIAAACKGADVAVGKGLAIQGKIAQENRTSAKKSVEKWLKDLNF